MKVARETMRVRELMERLERFDPDLEVLCATEDDELLPPGHGFRLLEINELSPVEGEKRRGDDQIPTLALRRSELSEKFVLIDVTADF